MWAASGQMLRTNVIMTCRSAMIFRYGLKTNNNPNVLISNSSAETVSGLDFSAPLFSSQWSIQLVKLAGCHSEQRMVYSIHIVGKIYRSVIPFFRTSPWFCITNKIKLFQTHSFQSWSVLFSRLPNIGLFVCLMGSPGESADLVQQCRDENINFVHRVLFVMKIETESLRLHKFVFDFGFNRTRIK